jgi:hypothetical protein
MMNRTIEPFFDPQHAGRIRRYHTFPHVAEQDIAAHSQNVLRILLAIWPDCPRHLLIHGVVHDLGEIGSGDAPMYAKRNHPSLKPMLDRIEYNTHLNMCLPWFLPPPQELTPFEKAIFKLAEIIEIFERSWYEFNLGNNYAEFAIGVHRNLVNEQADKIREMRENAPEGLNINWLLLRASQYYERRDKIETEIYERSKRGQNEPRINT